MIRKGFLIMTLVLASLAGGTAQVADRPWSAVAMPPGGRLLDVAALDSYRFWTVGVGGLFFESMDGGRVWNRLDAGVSDATLNAVTADVSMNMVVAVGADGWMVRYQPGATPLAQQLHAQWTLTGVDIANGIILVAGMDEFQRPLILRSADGGQNFVRLQTTVNVPVTINGAQFMSITTAVVFGGAHRQEGSGSPIVLVSRDAGITWDESLGGSFDFNVSAIAGTSLQWVATGVQLGDGTAGVFRSMDEGTSWVFEEHPELMLVTDIIRADGPDLIAVGLRVLDADPEPIVVASEFHSRDAGTNWGVRDISDTEGAVVRIARGGDRVIAVGFEQNSYRRWYDRTLPRGGVDLLRKHLPLGTSDVTSFVDRRFDQVFRNATDEPLTVASVVLHDMSGCMVQQPTIGSIVAPGGELAVQIVHGPQSVGNQWGVLQVVFTDGTTAEVLVSSTGQQPAGNGDLTLAQPVLDLGNVVTTEIVEQAFDVMVNNASEARQVERIEITGSDLIAFAITDMPEFPVTLAPGETLPLTVVFEPMAAGVYHVQLEIHTARGVQLLPVVAEVRSDAFEHVVDLGQAVVGERVERDVMFRHQTWNTALELHTIHGPSAPFAVTSTSPLPFEGGPLDAIEVTLALEPQTVGRFASTVALPWSFGGAAGFAMREDRRIVRGVVTGVTSVPSEAADLAPIGVFPHPAAELATVSLPVGPLWNSLSVMDMHGRTLFRRTLDEGQTEVAVDLSNVVPGTYVITARHERGVISRPVIRF